ncbi:hypothetical protein ACE6H2_000764 [Prunus campanulata]
MFCDCDSTMFIAHTWIRNKNVHISQDSKPASNVGDDSVLTSLPEPQDIAEGDLEPSLNSDPSCSKDSLIWKEESYDAPNSKFILQSRIIANVSSFVKDEL